MSTEPGESLTFNSSHTGLNELELDKSRAKTKPTESGKSPNFKLSRAGLNELHAELDTSTKNTDHNMRVISCWSFSMSSRSAHFSSKPVLMKMGIVDLEIGNLTSQISLKTIKSYVPPAAGGNTFLRLRCHHQLPRNHRKVLKWPGKRVVRR